MDFKSGVLQISTDDDKSLGNGTYSSLDYFRYRIYSNDGNTWSAWTANFTETQKYTLKDSGNYLLETYAVDKSGNSTDSVFTGIVKIVLTVVLIIWIMIIIITFKLMLNIVLC